LLAKVANDNAGLLIKPGKPPLPNGIDHNPAFDSI